MIDATPLYSTHKLIYSRDKRAILSTRDCPRGGPSTRASYTIIYTTATTQATIQATVQDITIDEENSKHKYSKKAKKSIPKMIYNNSQHF